MDITQIRKDTAGCESRIHFNNAGAALMPTIVANAMRDYITEEEIRGGYELADEKRQEIDSFYSYAAELLGCKSSNIAFTTNATDGYNKALSSIAFKRGDVILISENDYSSNYIAFISLQRRFGIKLVQINNSENGEVDLDDLEFKIKTLLPKLVSISHVPTSSGLVQPVEKIGEITSKYDVLYLLDACQSLGQLKVDAVATRADFISGTFRKFLRGPRGAGLLYVSDKALTAGHEPLFIDLRGAEWIMEDQYVPLADAKRFEEWETAYALMMGSKEALKYLLAIGIDEIQNRNQVLVSKLRNGLAGLDFVRLQDRGSTLCNIVTFTVDRRSEKETKKYFAEHGINIYTISKSAAIIDFNEKQIKWVMRVSPHYYNTEEEVDRFVGVLKSL